MSTKSPEPARLPDRSLSDRPLPDRQLPARPNLRHLKDQAKDLPRLPGHYERPGEVVECTPLEYALLFPEKPYDNSKIVKLLSRLV